MLLWVSVLVLAPVSGQFEAVPKAVISLHPPWTVFFKGEAVTLTCHVSHIYPAKNRELYQWYLGTEILREIPGNTLKVQDSGEYKCQTQNSLLSDGVTLIFSTAKLILQAPPSVFEGDSVTLKCQANVDLALKNKTLYKNGKMLKILDESSSFHIQQAGLKDNGEYHCAGSEINCSFSSNRIKIQVQELFPHPVLRSRPSWTTSGNQLTLICETQLPPQKSDVQLQFRFFRDGQIVEAGSKNFLKIQNPSSGMSKGPSYYWCEAHTVTSNVCKKSQKSQIHTEVPVSRPVLTLSPPRAQALEGHRVTLHCEAWRGSPPILYQFYHGDVLLRSISAPTARRESFSITLTAESSGKYSCTADNGFGPQRSDTRSLSVTVPASRPILTLRVPGTRAVVGDVMELHCEAHKGSPPILYRFYHNDVFLGSRWLPSGRGTSFNLPLTPEHSGSYACEADNGQGAQRSDTASLRVTVPASRPVLTLRVPGTQAVVGDVMELHCEAHRGSPPILYRFYHDDVFLGSSSAASGGRASFNLSLTPEHSGSYACEADNGLGAQRSDTASLRVTVPASHPILTLRVPGTQAVVGDVMELHCEAHRGSPPILYRFYHDDVFLGSSSAPSGGRASFNLSLTPEHSGSYACEADNGLGAQRSEAVPLNVTVPASRPILTLRAPGAQAFPGDVMELHCEAHRGSPPILYRFYHDNVILGSSSVPSGGGASFNLSLTAEHTGNYSCEADNGLGAQCSEAVTLSISGLTGSRLGPVATGVAGGLLGMGGLAVVALLLYCRLPRKAGGRTSDPSRNPSNSDPQEPTYYNVPGWIELQPVYSNVNPKGGDVVYSEVRRIQEGNKHAVASDSALRLLWTYLPSHGPIASPQPYSAQGSSVIYSQVKAGSFLTSSAESAHTPCTPSNPGGQRL